MPNVGVYKVSRSVIRSKTGKGKEAINYSLRVPGFIADHLDIATARFGVRVTDEGILYFPVKQMDETSAKTKLPEWMQQQKSSSSTVKAEAV